MVNGPMTPFGNKTLLPPSITPSVPPVDTEKPAPAGWKDVLKKEGPQGLAKKIRAHKQLLLTDTTLRDAHQVKLAAFFPKKSRGVLSSIVFVIFFLFFRVLESAGDTCPNLWYETYCTIHLPRHAATLQHGKLGWNFAWYLLVMSFFFRSMDRLFDWLVACLIDCLLVCLFVCLWDGWIDWLIEKMSMNAFASTGGATFDVAMRFLYECPWERLQQLSSAAPNVLSQCLVRGANGVGYTSYPDNAIFKFCELAHKNGMDIFRVFDALNYLPNLQMGIEAAGASGAVVEGSLAYSGDISDPNKKKYTLEYFVKLADELVKMGVHILCIKDMAGLLKPSAARMLIGALR